MPRRSGSSGSTRASHSGSGCRLRDLVAEPLQVGRVPLTQQRRRRRCRRRPRASRAGCGSRAPARPAGDRRGARAAAPASRRTARRGRRASAGAGRRARAGRPSGRPRPRGWKRRHEAAEVLPRSAGRSGTRGNHGWSPNASTNRGSRSSSLVCHADHSRRTGSRTIVNRSQPVLGQHPLALVALEVGEPVRRPQVRVVHGQRRRHLRQARPREPLRRDSGQLREQPQDARAARLRDRQEQHAQLRQHDRALEDVVREHRP